MPNWALSIVDVVVIYLLAAIVYRSARVAIAWVAWLFSKRRRRLLPRTGFYGAAKRCLVSAFNIVREETSL